MLLQLHAQHLSVPGGVLQGLVSCRQLSILGIHRVPCCLRQLPVLLAEGLLLLLQLHDTSAGIVSLTALQSTHTGPDLQAKAGCSARATHWIGSGCMQAQPSTEGVLRHVM